MSSTGHIANFMSILTNLFCYFCDKATETEQKIRNLARRNVEVSRKLSHTCALILFPLKKGPKMGSAGGDEKAGMHLKDKFSGL